MTASSAKLSNFQLEFSALASSTISLMIGTHVAVHIAFFSSKNGILKKELQIATQQASQIWNGQINPAKLRGIWDQTPGLN